jgi:hypothetical protein
MFNRDFGIAGLRSAIKRFSAFGSPEIALGASLSRPSEIPGKFPAVRGYGLLLHCKYWRFAHRVFPSAKIPCRFPAVREFFGR